MKKSKDLGCPSLEDIKASTCEDGTFEASIVGVIVSNFLNYGEKIAAELTLFGDPFKVEKACLMQLRRNSIL